VNLARYNLETHSLDRLPAVAGLTPEGLCVLSLQFQLVAISEGEPVSGILVGWQDAPSDYLGIFMLGDMVDQPMPSTMLDRIERLARGH
jgi:hypothetical protein